MQEIVKKTCIAILLKVLRIVLYCIILPTWRDKFEFNKILLETFSANARCKFNRKSASQNWLAWFSSLGKPCVQLHFPSLLRLHFPNLTPAPLSEPYSSSTFRTLL